MIYLKQEFGNVEVKIYVCDDGFYSTCPVCGKEHNLDNVADYVDDDGYVDFSGTSVYCRECCENSAKK